MQTAILQPHQPCVNTRPRLTNPIIFAFILWLTLIVNAGAQGSSSPTSLGFNRGGINVTNDLQFVMIGNTPDATAERALTGSSTITVTDGGANGEVVLTVNGPLIPTAGGTGTATVAVGDLLVGSGVNTWGKLTIGTPLYNLRVNAGGTALEWAAPSAGGTVTSFSAGDLSPLFTTAEADVTTTPALTFSLSNAAANTALGNWTSGSATPTYGNSATVRASLGLAASGANTDITSLDLTTPLVIADGGTNNGSLGVSALALVTGDGSKLVQTPTGTALQSWRVNAGGTAIEAYTPTTSSGTVTSFSAGDLSPLFTTSESDVTTTPALTFSLSNAAAYTVLGNNTSGSAAPAYQTMVAQQLPAGTVDYGGGGGSTSIRAIPTSGTLTGEYWHIGNWTSTNTITCNRCRLHITGTFTLDHAVTVNTELPGGLGGTGAVSDGGVGYGFGAGNPGREVSGSATAGGGGGGNGGAGGIGGGTSGQGCGRGGQAYEYEHSLLGSSGGGGTGNTTSGGAGGAAGGTFFVQATGAISINGNITATGGAGANGGGGASDSGGGGGSGGTVILISTNGNVTLTSGDTISCVGGAGGGGSASNGGGGGGGGGGRVELLASGTATNSGTITLTGGAAGSDPGTASSPAAGSTGVSVVTSSYGYLHRDAQ